MAVLFWALWENGLEVKRNNANVVRNKAEQNEAMQQEPDGMFVKDRWILQI